MARSPKRKHKVKITIDYSLNKYSNEVGCTEKLERANKILRQTGHPETILKTNSVHL